MRVFVPKSLSFFTSNQRLSLIDHFRLGYIRLPVSDMCTGVTSTMYARCDNNRNCPIHGALGLPIVRRGDPIR